MVGAAGATPGPDHTGTGDWPPGPPVAGGVAGMMGCRGSLPGGGLPPTAGGTTTPTPPVAPPVTAPVPPPPAGLIGPIGGSGPARLSGGGIVPVAARLGGTGPPGVVPGAAAGGVGSPGDMLVEVC